MRIATFEATANSAPNKEEAENAECLYAPLFLPIFYTSLREIHSHPVCSRHLRFEILHVPMTRIWTLYHSP